MICMECDLARWRAAMSRSEQVGNRWRNYSHTVSHKEIPFHYSPQHMHARTHAHMHAHTHSEPQGNQLWIHLSLSTTAHARTHTNPTTTPRQCRSRADLALHADQTHGKLTTLSDCSSDSEITVLAVHVVGATSRVVTQPYSDILNLQRWPVIHLVEQQGKGRSAPCSHPVHCTVGSCTQHYSSIHINHHTITTSYTIYALYIHVHPTPSSRPCGIGRHTQNQCDEDVNVV